MQKVYLLLRDNQQTGPHSLEELAQLQLKNSDLIWIEGKSAGWYYPNEVDALKTFLKKTDAGTDIIQPPKTEAPLAPIDAPPPKKIYVSMPANAKQQKPPIPNKTTGDYLEHRAEQMRKKVQNFPLDKEAPKEDKPITPKESPTEPKQPATPVIEIEEVPTFAINKRIVAKEGEPVTSTKTISPPTPKKDIRPKVISTVTPEKKSEKKNTGNYFQIMAAAVVLLMIGGGGWWVYSSFASREPQNQLAKQTVNPIQQPQVNPVVDNTTPIADTSLLENNSTDYNQPITPTSSTSQTITSKNKKQQAAKKQPIVENSTTTNPEPQPTVTDVPEVKNTEPVVQEQKTETVVPEPEKKPGLFKKIGGLFKKKNKETTTINNDGDPNATSRGDAIPTDITDQVDIKLNTSSNNWMIGVQGLKLTIKNNSNVVLKKAAVDVIYYNDKNAVIEKKRIFFSDVPPKKTQAIAAPDHQYADHAGYKILTAIGEK